MLKITQQDHYQISANVIKSEPPVANDHRGKNYNFARWKKREKATLFSKPLHNNGDLSLSCPE